MANTIQRQTLTAEAAKKLVAAAEKKAEELKKHMVITVCDESGNLKEFTRMDNAPLLSVQIAQDTAYTAISFGIATHEWFEFIKDDPPFDMRMDFIICHPKNSVLFHRKNPKIAGRLLTTFSE